MNILSLARESLKFLKENGFRALISVIISKYGQQFFYIKPKTKWNAGLISEVRYWDSYIKTKGLQRPDLFELKFDPDLPLQERPAALLPNQDEINILDVGAGPLTYLGRKLPGKRLNIIAVDPLADEYDRIMDKYSVKPLIQTEKLAGEELTKRFGVNSFDLVFARNSIDHSYDPEKAILQMISVVKPAGYVLLEHIPNVAKDNHYKGLHQWNFSLSADGDFIINSKFENINFTKKFADICTTTCEIVKEYGRYDLLITRIQKKTA
jgi:SAM-dependent methyltransferase